MTVCACAAYVNMSRAPLCDINQTRTLQRTHSIGSVYVTENQIEKRVYNGHKHTVP